MSTEENFLFYGAFIGCFGCFSTARLLGWHNDLLVILFLLLGFIVGGIVGGSLYDYLFDEKDAPRALTIRIQALTIPIQSAASKASTKGGKIMCLIGLHDRYSTICRRCHKWV